MGGAKDDAASQAQRAEALTLPTLRSIGNFLSLDSGGGGGGGGGDRAEEMVNVALAQDNFLHALVAVLESAGSWHRSYAKEAAWVACNIAATGAAHRAALVGAGGVRALTGILQVHGFMLYTYMYYNDMLYGLLMSGRIDGDPVDGAVRHPTLTLTLTLTADGAVRHPTGGDHCRLQPVRGWSVPAAGVWRGATGGTGGTGGDGLDGGRAGGLGSRCTGA